MRVRDNYRTILVVLVALAGEIGGLTNATQEIAYVAGQAQRGEDHLLVAALTGAAVSPTIKLASIANTTTTPSIFIDNLLFIDFF